MNGRSSSDALPTILSCAPNFRDVAHHVPALRRGLLYRSDLVLDPDTSGGAAIAACGIRLVVDLRGSTERERMPNRWFTEAGVEVLAVDIAAGADPGRLVAALGPGAGATGSHAMMTEVYRSFPAGAIPALDAIGDRVACGDLPIMIHCSAGKDRTGFIVAVLLLAIGVDVGAVTSDYLESAGRAHPRTHEHARAMIRALGVQADDDALACIADAHPDYLDAALAEVTAMYGSFDAYLREAKLTGERLKRIKDRLLA